MRTVFADTQYWIALAIPLDQWHERAIEVSKSIHPVRLITTDEILVEFLNYFSGRGIAARNAGVQMVLSINANPNIQVVPQTRESFLAGLRLYEERSDKEYSLTDCISLNVMNNNGIVEALTRDSHFSQEGKTLLL
ncbi:MAG TPA: nucleic acid-binding protein [Bacteroidota bacterium]|nr:nucleic acid-binding protein [Bacteroidota bacterium]